MAKAKAAAAAALRGTPTATEATKKAAAAAAELEAAASASAVQAKQKAGKVNEEDDEEESDDEDDDDGFSNPVMTGPRKSMQLLKAGAARPVAKRPARNWRRGILHQLEDLIGDLSDKENAIWIFAVCALVLLAIMTFMRDQMEF